MAKLVGLVGSIVNKAGNFVFSTWKGIQVAKAYQPNVVNPRSAGQTAQRTKFDYAVQYGIAMNRVPYLKQLWSLITPSTRVPYNEFVSRNLRNANFEPDNTLCPNKMIISDNNDYIQGLVWPVAGACAAGVWTLDGLDIDGCGTAPDGLLIVQVFQSNLLADPSQSPFRDVRICETYVVEAAWPDAALVTIAHFEDSFDICCPACADPAAECCDAAVWLIPVWSNGADASADPSLITKAGSAILACEAA